MLARSATEKKTAQHERPAVIAVVDYKAGNLTSVMKALRAVGADPVVGEAYDEPAVSRHLVYRAPLRGGVPDGLED